MGDAFISRTSDMAGYPRGRSFATAAFEAVARAGYVPVDMSGFPAANETPAQYCRRRVQECDAYLGVIGFRYGSLVPDSDISYTELEFLAATDGGVPRLLFLLDEETPLPPRLVDLDQGRICNFRERIRKAGIMVRVFTSAEDLDGKIFHALHSLRPGYAERGSSRYRNNEGHAAPGETPPTPVRRHRKNSGPRHRMLGPAASGPAGHEEQPPLSLPFAWNVPPRIAHFVGRRDQLRQVHEFILRSDVTSLVGMGGVGKTALVVEYAHRHADDFDVVWWVPAADPTLVADEVAALGLELGMPDGAEWPAVSGVLRRERRRWLLVLDNVDDPKLIGPLRPSDPHGRLLVTCQLTGLDGLGATLEVTEFSAAEAVSLLTGRVAGIDAAVAERIAQLLGYLPLAVEQAAGYLTQTCTPPHDYTALLEERLGEMLSRGQVANRPGVTIANLWELSITRLRAEQPAATALLELCASLGPDPIPLDLFTGGTAELPDGALRHAAKDPLEWMDTIGVLVGYSLVRRDGSAVTVHRLIAAATRTAMDPVNQAAADATVARLLTAALPANVRDPAGWPRWRQLLPHSRAVLDHDDTGWNNTAIAWLSAGTGLYLAHRSRPDLAIPYLYRAVALNETHRGADHPTTLVSRNNLVYAYHAAGRVDEAINLVKQVLTDRERVLGPDHPDTLATRNDLAAGYVTAGRVHEAIGLYKQILADRERILGPDHTDTLTSRDNLAYTYEAAGQADEAIILHEQVLAERQRVLGPDHPDTLITRNNLAAAYEAAGRADEAIILHEQVLADRQRILGPHHPHTLHSRNKLAGAYRAAGQIDEAIILYERVLADFERVLRPDHPAIRKARADLDACRAR